MLNTKKRYMQFLLNVRHMNVYMSIYTWEYKISKCVSWKSLPPTYTNNTTYKFTHIVIGLAGARVYLPYRMYTRLPPLFAILSFRYGCGKERRAPASGDATNPIYRNLSDTRTHAAIFKRTPTHQDVSQT